MVTRPPVAKILALLWLSIVLGWAVVSAFHELPFELRFALESGRDPFGRPLFWLIPKAAGISLFWTLFGLFASLIVGGILGSLTALGPPLAQALSRHTTGFFLTFPTLLIALFFAARLGPGYTTLALALVFSFFPGMSRLISTQLIQLKNTPLILNSQALGGSALWIFSKHLFPAIRPILLSKMPSWIAHALITEATLSALGVGLPLGETSLGGLVYLSKEYWFEAPHIAYTVLIPFGGTLLALDALLYKKDQL